MSPFASIKIIMFHFGMDDYNLALGVAGSGICCDYQFCDIQESCCLIAEIGFLHRKIIKGKRFLPCQAYIIKTMSELVMLGFSSFLFLPFSFFFLGWASQKDLFIVNELKLLVVETKPM